jgi:L-type amino acid transporter 8
MQQSLKLRGKNKKTKFGKIDYRPSYV